MDAPRILRLMVPRPMRSLLGAAFSVLLALLLTATIYWTLFDPKWVPFLAGTLFAAVLATASQASSAQWTIARRTRQLERTRARIELELKRSHHATESFHISEARLRLLADAIAEPLLYVGRDERCLFFNAAAARQAQKPPAELDGHPLREVLGEQAYLELAPQLALSLAGKALSHELSWESRYSVAHRPFPAGAAHPAGVYLLFSPVAPASPAPAGAERGSSAELELRVPREGGEALYMRAIASELTGWDDPPAKLLEALRDDKFLLLQQAIVPLKIGLVQPRCCEILLRLQEEEDNLLPPGGFLPLAESYGMMEELDRWVVRTLIVRTRERQRRSAQWHAPLHWVNLSSSAVRSAEFARSVQRQIEKAEFDGRLLCFEIAEPDVIGHLRGVERLIETLKPLGCRFAVDAFGSVKPAFADLKRLAFDFVKIDGVIVQNMLRNPAELARARAINTACQQIGVRTAAEFVEDDATLETLRSIGIDYAQGFGIARPQPLFGPVDAAPAAAAASA